MIAGKVRTFQKDEKQAFFCSEKLAYSRPTFVTTKSALEQLNMSYWSDIGLVKPATRLEKNNSDNIP